MIHDTIFSPSFGNRPSYLVGRETAIQNLMAGLQSRPGSKGRATVLLGQRGSGKTVLLWELADRAAKEGFVVATPTVVSEGMLERVVEKIQDAGERHVNRPVRVSGGSIGALCFSAGLEFTQAVQESKSFEYKLLQLARKLSSEGKGVLILIDELQALKRGKTACNRLSRACRRGVGRRSGHGRTSGRGLGHAQRQGVDVS